MIHKAHNKYWKTHIHEISSKNKWVWDLTSWTSPRHSSVAVDIVHDGKTLSTTEQLWPAMNQVFYTATNRPVNHSILEEINIKQEYLWLPFSMQKLKDTITKTTTSSAPGWDHIHWHHLKHLIDPKKNPKTADRILEGFKTLFNSLVDHAVWLEEFY